MNSLRSLSQASQKGVHEQSSPWLPIGINQGSESTSQLNRRERSIELSFAANHALGLPSDTRHFELAAHMLKSLGIYRVGKSAIARWFRDRAGSLKSYRSVVAGMPPTRIAWRTRCQFVAKSHTRPGGLGGTRFRRQFALAPEMRTSQRWGK